MGDGYLSANARSVTYVFEGSLPLKEPEIANSAVERCGANL